MIFPSVDWFKALGAEMEADEARHRHIGEIDFILEGDFIDWQDMVDHLQTNDGRPGREFTLNFLSLPGIPLRCWSPDPLGRDMFFRFNQSLQAFINASHRLETNYPSPVS